MHFLKVQQALKGSLLLLDLLDLAERHFVLLQAFKLRLDVTESRLKHLLLVARISQCILHFGQLLVELDGATDFLQDGQEPVLALDDQVLHLVLLDDLELRVGLEREAATLE